MQLLIATVLLALFAVSLTSSLRAFRRIGDAAERGVRPWGCDMCMASWALVLAVAALAGWRLAGGGLQLDPLLLFAALPAHGLAVLLLARLRPPPLFPEDEETR